MPNVRQSYVASIVSTVLVCGGLGCTDSSSPSSPSTTAAAPSTSSVPANGAPVINSVNVTLSMTGEVNGAGVADYDQIFTKQ